MVLWLVKQTLLYLLKWGFAKLNSLNLIHIFPQPSRSFLETFLRLVNKEDQYAETSPSQRMGLFFLRARFSVLIRKKHYLWPVLITSPLSAKQGKPN